MKSKSFNFPHIPSEAGGSKTNKTFDFIGLYKSANESNVSPMERRKSSEDISKENNSKIKLETSKIEHHKNKKKNKNDTLELSKINIEGPVLDVSVSHNSPVRAKATSTPQTTSKRHSPKVKSIMKNSYGNNDENMEDTYSTPYKSKKRNKSVSFMLEDGEEVVVKKTKADTSKVNKRNGTPKKNSKKEETSPEEKIKKLKKLKKNRHSEKENDLNSSQEVSNEELNSDVPMRKPKDKVKSLENDSSPIEQLQNDQKLERKKHIKKSKKKVSTEGVTVEPTGNESNNNDDAANDNKPKKLKKKKRHMKSNSRQETADTTETEGEPATKSRKTEVKPEAIVENLEHLTIGDNPHTLTNLLDEMTVVDKNEKKKNKKKIKKESLKKPASASSSETPDLEKIEEGKEKIKWKKRKWNKDKKGDLTEESLLTSIIVENLPLSMLFNYRYLLNERFEKYGIIKKIGIAEVFPNEDSKPVFATTIVFYSDGAATDALGEDGGTLAESRMRVKRPLPATQTTLVVRSYGELTEQTLSSVFSNAGRIRNIKLMVKGRKSMATAFIEFDGPESVERAMKMADDLKISGKKIYLAKFEQRKTSKPKESVKSPDSENEGDSENSN